MEQRGDYTVIAETDDVILGQRSYYAYMKRFPVIPKAFSSTIKCFHCKEQIKEGDILFHLVEMGDRPHCVCKKCLLEKVPSAEIKLKYEGIL